MNLSQKKYFFYRNAKSKPKNNSKKEQLLPSHHFISNGYTSSEISLDFSKEESRDDVSVSTETSTVKSFNHCKPNSDSENLKSKFKNRKNPKGNKESRTPKSKPEKAKISSSKKLDDIAPGVIRTSTPVEAFSKPKKSHHHQRSSSLPPRRDGSFSSEKSGYPTPRQYITAQENPEKSQRGRSRSSSRAGKRLNLSDSSFRSSSTHVSIMSTPEPPTFLVIEKTMGQKSMIICWTPPLLDMVIVKFSTFVTLEFVSKSVKFKIAVISQLGVL